MTFIKRYHLNKNFTSCMYFVIALSFVTLSSRVCSSKLPIQQSSKFCRIAMLQVVFAPMRHPNLDTNEMLKGGFGCRFDKENVGVAKLATSCG